MVTASGQEIHPEHTRAELRIPGVEPMLRLPVRYRVRLDLVSASASHRECNTVSDISETLDQLDRRLDELRRQVAVLAEEPQQAAQPSPPPAGNLHSVPAPPPGLTDLEAALGLTNLPERGRVAEPEGANAPLPGVPGEAPVETTSDMGQLMAVREQLMAGARELARAYERQLGLLEQMAVSGLPASSESSAPSSVPPAAPPAITRTLSGLVPPPADAVDQARPVFFEGMVELVVSGAHRIQTIEVLEDALARARHVDYVYVRRCHRGQVRLELSLAGGAELLGELNRVLPFSFAVTSATGTEIALSLEGER